MKLECLNEVFEGVSILPRACLRNGEKLSGKECFAGLTSISETGLTPLHGGSQRLFGAFVGRLHALLIEKTEETVEMLANRVGEIGDVSEGVKQIV